MGTILIPLHAGDVGDKGRFIRQDCPLIFGRQQAEVLLSQRSMFAKVRPAAQISRRCIWRSHIGHAGGAQHHRGVTVIVAKRPRLFSTGKQEEGNCDTSVPAIGLERGSQT